MKVFNKFYSKLVFSLRKETKSIVRTEVVQDALKQRALRSSEKVMNTQKRAERIVVSLTTFSTRINSVYLAIESIAEQTMKPDEIVLWISEDHFSLEKLPITVKRLISRGLKVNFRKDVGPHTKLLYAIKEYPNDIIITVDDDIIYPVDLIENLYNAHLECPQAICCHAAMRVAKDKKGKFLPYKLWMYANAKREYTSNLLPLGVNGVLYYPGCFSAEVFNENLFKNICPTADDIWFKLMSIKVNDKTVVTGSYNILSDYFSPLESSQISALAQSNIIGGQNDKQLKAVIDHFQLII